MSEQQKTGNNPQLGFLFLPFLLVFTLVVIIGISLFRTFGNSSFSPFGNTSQKNGEETIQSKSPFDDEKQESCPEPFIFQMPIDINKATSVLYPGQVRGGDYKAHGGFRFDNSLPDEIIVTAPIDARIIAGARYPANTGDTQYTFDFEHPCGIRYRLGHLLTLSPKFQKIAGKFPMPEGLDSRTTQVYPPIEVKKGEIIATAVGLTKDGNSKNGTNTFVDWGVYDYRQKNEASKNPDWAADHISETYQYAVCLFDWIAPEDRVIVLALPSSDYQNGKTSDYCK